MRILVTGGAGFQGSHIVDRLLSDGHQVSVLNTYSGGANDNLAAIANKINLIWGSITDREVVNKSVRDNEVIFHLAAYINVDESLAFPGQTIQTNVLGTTNILDAARASQARVIFASSCEVYGDGHRENKFVSESSEMKPNSPYAASKAAADRICYSYYRSFDLDVTIVRPFNVFGERQKAGTFGALIPKLVHQAGKGENLNVFGAGEQERDYCYISDIVEAYMLVFGRSDLKGREINFATGKNTKVIDIAKYIANKFGVGIRHLPARPGEVKTFNADISLAKSLGWQAKTSIWEGIDRYIDWAKTNGKI